MSATLKIKVTEEFIEQRDRHAVKYSKSECPTNAAYQRADCEVYEWHMINVGAWSDDARWSVDGVSDKYGNVDVKMVYKYWNIDGGIKIRNLMRQHGIIDHYYFIERIVWPDGPLVAGDEVEIGFVGVMTWAEMAKKLEVSFKKADSYYVDVRKHGKGIEAETDSK